jgi:hypothetical protein
MITIAIRISSQTSPPSRKPGVSAAWTSAYGSSPGS